MKFGTLKIAGFGGTFQRDDSTKWWIQYSVRGKVPVGVVGFR